MAWIRRRWWLLLIALIAAVGIGVVVVPYVYIHFINDPAPRLTFDNRDKERAGGASTDTTSTDTTSTGATSAEASSTGNDATDGNWIVASPSVAGYRVKETLNGQSSEGVGRTGTVDGRFTLSGAEVTASEFNVDLSTLKSDENRRDKQVRTRLLETDEFPVATFVLDQPIALGSIPADGVLVTATANGTLSLHGVEKPVALDVQARRNGATIEVLATTLLTFADFGIEDPSVSPFVSVGKTGTLEVQLTLRRAAS